jgi:hypothetical protein
VEAFLRNHADGIAAMDLFVVPTIFFRRLFGLLIMGHGWSGRASDGRMDRQVREACGWEQIPRYRIRDRDGAYGEIFMRRVCPSVFEIARRLLAHPGKTHTQNG